MDNTDKYIHIFSRDITIENHIIEASFLSNNNKFSIRVHSKMIVGFSI